MKAALSGGTGFIGSHVLDEDTRRELAVDTLAGMRKDLRVEAGRPVVAELMADVAEAVSRRATAVSKDVYKVIVREIPELRDDKPTLGLLASSVDANINTCLQIMQHRIDLAAVKAPASASFACLASSRSSQSEKQACPTR